MCEPGAVEDSVCKPVKLHRTSGGKIDLEFSLHTVPTKQVLEQEAQQYKVCVLISALANCFDCGIACCPGSDLPLDQGLHRLT